MARFEKYVGIDYSGAGTPDTRLAALRVFSADRSSAPLEVGTPAEPHRNWTRRGVADWLAEEILKSGPLLAGIDHGFSFPLGYFERHGLTRDWHAFLDDFQRHWPTDAEGISVSDIREGRFGNSAARAGDPRWLRLADRWTPSAKSVFQFDVQGQVANSTHAGLPWLRKIRERCGARVHFWPFDGWEIPEGRSVLAEVYPSLWMRRYPRAGRDPDRHAAFSACAWLRRADLDGSLPFFLNPPLTPQERQLARVEGWILGAV